MGGKNKTVKLLLGIIGNVAALGLFTAPIKTILRIIQTRDTEDFSSLPYISALFNCLLWTFYGLPGLMTSQIFVVTINGLGAVLESFYIIVFLMIGNKQVKFRTAMLTAAVVGTFAAAAVGVLVGLKSIHERGRIIGIFADILCVAMYGSPLGVLKLVIETKSVEYMPFFLSLNTFLSGAAWTAYALYVMDNYILIPNALGVVLGAIQLLVFWMYSPRNSSRLSLPASSSSSRALLFPSSHSLDDKEKNQELGTDSSFHGTNSKNIA
eukprot:TRINITY_DN12792_c0_g1_i1.p1 TRINITY_DN12792_c0_g1~~TRINITY_DN12792_c0_g1_i1.p1  ORF type:complete len:267 (+),score=55.05 TRINITY_DN12792_c0_g1_i1:167-967(+)